MVHETIGIPVQIEGKEEGLSLFQTLIRPAKITKAMPIFREDHHFLDRGELL